MTSLASVLPNDLIMRIVREADGGYYTHKTKFLYCLEAIQEVGGVYGDEIVYSSQFLYCLLECDNLSESVYRRICLKNNADIHPMFESYKS